MNPMQGCGETHSQIVFAIETVNDDSFWKVMPLQGPAPRNKSFCVVACSNTHMQGMFSGELLLQKKTSHNMNREISHRISTAHFIIEFLSGEDVYDTLLWFKKQKQKQKNWSLEPRV